MKRGLLPATRGRRKWRATRTSSGMRPGRPLVCERSPACWSSPLGRAGGRSCAGRPHGRSGMRLSCSRPTRRLPGDGRGVRRWPSSGERGGFSRSSSRPASQRSGGRPAPWRSPSDSRRGSRPRPPWVRTKTTIWRCRSMTPGSPAWSIGWAAATTRRGGSDVSGSATYLAADQAGKSGCSTATVCGWACGARAHSLASNARGSAGWCGTRRVPGRAASNQGRSVRSSTGDTVRRDAIRSRGRDPSDWRPASSPGHALTGGAIGCSPISISRARW
jgi:hypothetical protein